LKQGFDGSSALGVDKYFQIRVKTTEFWQKSAIAVYMFDITNQVRMMRNSWSLRNAEVQDEKIWLGFEGLITGFEPILENSSRIVSEAKNDTTKECIEQKHAQAKLLLKQMQMFADVKRHQNGTFTD